MGITPITMTSPRRKHSAEFKTRVVLDALSGKFTINELAAKYELHPVQITKWKQTFVKQAPQIFGNELQKKDEDKDKLIEELYKKVGRGQMEVEWLKKKVGLSP